jgi:hypothetical protein
MGALFPHPFGSTSRGSTLIGSLASTLDHLIILLVNVSRGSIIVADDVLYFEGRSYVLGILDMVYYNFFGI